jgi:amidohydrolase
VSVRRVTPGRAHFLPPWGLPMKPHSLDDLGVAVSQEVRDAFDGLVALRRDLHAHPELSNQEHRTRQFVLDHLAVSGVAATPLGATGVAGIIQGRGPGRVLLLRADMDALPITEETGAPYCSQNPGVMHACGHDAHTAMLLTTARLLAARGIALGAVKLLFQPAEEMGNGAQQMIDAGILTDPVVDASLTFHVWSQYGIGQVVARGGPAMASVDEFRITVKGRGVHAAMPEEGVDPILAACHIVTAAQSLVSRNTSPHEAGVLSFTSLTGGNAFNVIPDRVVILGTIRTFLPEVRSVLKNGLVRVCTAVGGAMQAESVVEFVEENDPVANDPAMAAIVQSVAGEVVGTERVVTPHPLMPGEDIGLIHQRVPGVIAFLGCGEGDGSSFPHHHPRFDIDERVLPIGVEIALRFVTRFLG